MDLEKRLDLQQILTDLESFLIRRFICQLTTKNYNKFFAQVIKDIKENGELTSTTIRAYLLMQKAETSKWPTDQEFRTAWLDLPFYSRLKMAQDRHLSKQ